MKKIAKVLLTLGVLLMVPAGLSAGPTLFLCSTVVTFPAPVPISVLVPIEAVDALEAHGWVCCLPPDPCSGGGD